MGEAGISVPASSWSHYPRSHGESSGSRNKSPVDSGNEQAPCQSHGDTGSAQSHLLLLQADHGAIAATAPLPLEGCNLFRLDFQDLLLLFMLQLQFLGGGRKPSEESKKRGVAVSSGNQTDPSPTRPARARP